MVITPADRTPLRDSLDDEQQSQPASTPRSLCGDSERERDAERVGSQRRNHGDLLEGRADCQGVVVRSAT
jgi:hypothetical protein